MKKVLAIFAHPDDEAFGPGGTIALWAQQGIEVHLLCATKGEAGICVDGQIASQVRANELESSAKILGIRSIQYLNYLDGEIGNIQMVELEKIISQKINEIQPDTLLTFNLNGVSGHLDHIAVASAVTKSFEKQDIAQQLYYFTEKKAFSNNVKDYFVYFPPGITEDQADEVIDISSVWDVRVQAMNCHQSQIKDIQWILALQENFNKNELFLVRKKQG